MATNSRGSFIATGLTAAWFGLICNPAAAAISIEGQVQGGGAPIANSTVTLWSASASAPSQLAQVKTDADGRFQISIDQSPGKDVSFYLVATGGEPAANKAGGNNPAIGLITVLGNTPPAKVRAFDRWGAHVVIEGDVWDDANRAALAAAAREGWSYVHPFADPVVIAGQGTLALEILDDLPDVDTVVTAIGGGGLASGVGVALRGRRATIRLIGVEPVGAPTLHDSLAAGHLVTLNEIGTAATTLAPRRSAAINLGLIRETVERIVLVDDTEMRDAARWLWRELGVGAELSSAAGVAAIRAGRIPLTPGERVCVVVCSAGSDGLA